MIPVGTPVVTRWRYRVIGVKARAAQRKQSGWAKYDSKNYEENAPPLRYACTYDFSLLAIGIAIGFFPMWVGGGICMEIIILQY